MQNRTFILYFFVFITSSILICSYDVQDNNRQHKLIYIAHEYGKKYALIIKGRQVVTDSSKFKIGQGLSSYHPSEISGYYYACDSEVKTKSIYPNCPHDYSYSKNYTKDFESYHTDGHTQQIGQVLVKEMLNKSFENEKNESVSGNIDSLKSNTKLFVMFKEQKTFDNDEGWVYGIINISSENAIEIINSGYIQNCVSCHSKSKYDRLLSAYQSYR